MENNIYSDANPVCPLRDKLTGALVGLARATEGNSHRVSNSTDMAMLDGLCALADDTGTNADSLNELINRMDIEKRRLIPDCYNCASPCGRTADYDVSILHSSDSKPVALRKLLLSGVCALSSIVRKAYLAGLADPQINEYFYRVLYAAGMGDWDERELVPMVTEFAQIEGKALNLLSRINPAAASDSDPR